MGIRIHKAMGWGMPIEKLAQLNGIERDQASDWIYERFDGKTPEDLTIPDEVMSRSWNDRSLMTMLQADLLSKRFVCGKDERAKLTPEDFGRAEDLFTLTDLESDDGHVIFFTTLHYRKIWYRYNNDLDYAFEQWRTSTRENETVHAMRGAQDDPVGYVAYLPYNPYPFANDLMLADGTRQPWDHFTRVEQHPEWLPAVPGELRWYLPKLGVLDEKGVLELRPILAQWWG